MDSFMGLITIVIFIVIIHLGFDIYLKIKNSRKEEEVRKLDVLKIITKHECFSNFSDNPGEFEKWISEFLTLKGYKNASITPKDNDDGKDLVVQNKKGEKVYVLCKLGDPGNWIKNVTMQDAQRFIGSMAGEGVKNGLVITTADISQDAKNYLIKLNGLGYKLQIIEGDALVKELYDLRKKHLTPSLNTIQG